LRKRKLELVVVSDIHLGSLTCHADELLSYLNSIRPKKLVLNGDIIDTWELNKGYFPTSHMKVIKKIIGMASQGTEVYYVAGNHDGNMRRFRGISMGNLHVVDKLFLELNGKNAWFFHGAIFENNIKKITWLSKLGIKNYDYLIKISAFFNKGFFNTKKKHFSLSKKPKIKTHKTAAYISSFEKHIADTAIDNNYDFAICGHIHQPKKEKHNTKKGKCTYLNSGDWVESLTALEYSFKRWKIYRYDSDKLLPFYIDDDLKRIDIHELISKITIQKEEEKREKEGGLSVDDSIF